MTLDASLRTFLVQHALALPARRSGVLSLSIVGTFADTQDLSGISDIDVVVILDHLTEWAFHDVLRHFQSCAPHLHATYGLNLHLNSTFGPLKFNQPDTVVFHVMVYDLASHARHCRQSPFTCYDWERSTLFAGQALSALHSVPRLMPGHFFSRRRGVSEYLDDYSRSVVSYRAYRFQDGEAIEERHEKPMSVKDRYEFAYHILRFLMVNLLKLLQGRNTVPPHETLVRDFQAATGETTPGLASFHAWLLSCKRANRFPEDEASLHSLNQGVHDLLDAFERSFHRLFPADGPLVEFRRHAPTALNDGRRFLGQTLNPPLLAPPVPLPDAHFDRVLSSPSTRARESAQALVPDCTCSADSRLAEIDYGHAEGQDLAWLNQHAPDIIEAWSRREDPPFPDGESQQDVLTRTQAFLRGLPRTERSLVLTHNVWLRCLLGNALGLPRHDWFRLNIPHLHPFQFRPLPDGTWIPDLSPETLRTLLQGIEQRKLLAAEAHRDPQVENRSRFWAEVFQRAPARPRLRSGTRLVPMAGEGKRFQDVGFTTPKPLIAVDGQPMISGALACLPPMPRAVYLLRESLLSPALRHTLQSTADQVTLVPVKTLTEGQACTCLLGLDHAPPQEPLLIAPCDNGMHWDDSAFDRLVQTPSVQVICWTFTRHLAITAKPEAWGYVQTDEQGRVRSVSVKKPATTDPFQEHCVIGTFWFRSAALFRELAEELIRRDLRVNGEFYVDSLVGLAAELGHDTRIFDVDHYISWGKPEDLFEYRKWKQLHQQYGM